MHEYILPTISYTFLSCMNVSNSLSNVALSGTGTFTAIFLPLPLLALLLDPLALADRLLCGSSPTDFLFLSLLFPIFPPTGFLIECVFFLRGPKDADLDLSFGMLFSLSLD